jgi:CBS domain-containing protein
MRVQEVMTDHVRCCGPDDDVATAAAMLWETDCGALPVVEDGRLAGIVTDRDICIAIGTRDRIPHELKVRDVETREVATCSPGDDVHSAMEVMRRTKVRRLPVVGDDGRLLGLLSLNDLILRADRRRGSGVSYDDVLNTIKAVSEHRSPTEEQTGHAHAAAALH